MSILVKIDQFLRESDMPPTRFGRLAVNDPRLVGDLRRGRQPCDATVRRIEAFLARQPLRHRSLPDQPLPIPPVH